MSYTKDYGYSSESFGEFIQGIREMTVPEGHKLRVVVDTDAVVVSWHPGWDEDGEELGDPIYLGKWWPQEALLDLLVNGYGLHAEGA